MAGEDARDQRRHLFVPEMARQAIPSVDVASMHFALLLAILLDETPQRRIVSSDRFEGDPGELCRGQQSSNILKT